MINLLLCSWAQDHWEAPYRNPYEILSCQFQCLVQAYEALRTLMLTSWKEPLLPLPTTSSFSSRLGTADGILNGWEWEKEGGVVFSSLQHPSRFLSCCLTHDDQGLGLSTPGGSSPVGESTYATTQNTPPSSIIVLLHTSPPDATASSLPCGENRQQDGWVCRARHECVCALGLGDLFPSFSL